MRIAFSGISEVKFVTLEGKPLPKKWLTATAFHWEEEAPRAREVFVRRGRVLNLNDEGTPDRTEYRELLRQVLREKVHVSIPTKEISVDALKERLPIKVKSNLKRSIPFALLRSFEEDCLARFEENPVKQTRTIQVDIKGPVDMTFKKRD